MKDSLPPPTKCMHGPQCINIKKNKCKLWGVWRPLFDVDEALKMRILTRGGGGGGGGGGGVSR